ncbi:PAS domain-containing protein [Lactococcus fujiensis]|nr:PAS domain-containing protein [Lactococcus fujiensis]
MVMTRERNQKDEDTKTFIEEQGLIHLPTGQFDLKLLRTMLNMMPFEIDLIDADDNFIYFTDSDTRMHHRTTEQLNQELLSLHPEKPEHIRPTVQKILESFHDGTASHYEQWFPMAGKTCYINYYALRDCDGRYLGCMEFTGDISRIQGLRGIRTPHNSGKSE